MDDELVFGLGVPVFVKCHEAGRGIAGDLDFCGDMMTFFFFY